tara:strand:- start:2561 stop:2950 length:390 start_codon:yes stop_codon:yes gene_type:complete
MDKKIPKIYYQSKYWVKNDKQVLVSFRPNQRGACKTLSKKRFGIITAWNPEGKHKEKKENEKANRVLESKLMELNLNYYKSNCGVGKHKEESFTVENIEKNVIIALGKLFNQKAVLYSTPEKTEIILCH